MLICSSNSLGSHMGRLEAPKVYWNILSFAHDNNFYPGLDRRTKISGFHRRYVTCIFMLSFESLLKYHPVAPLPFPGFRGCLVLEISNIIFVNFILLTVVDLGKSSAPRILSPALTIYCSRFRPHVHQCLEIMCVSLSYWSGKSLTLPNLDRVGSGDKLSQVVHRDGNFLNFSLPNTIWPFHRQTTSISICLLSR